VSRNKPTRVGDDNPRPWGPGADVSDSESTRVGDTNPSFDWASPRWRENDEPSQSDVETDRRDHDEKAPSKDAEGAINRKGSRDRRGGNRGRGSRS
jgi:hypothetical protein